MALCQEWGALIIHTKFPLPCIAHMIVGGNLLHYVVVHKVTKKKIIIADPNVGIVKLTQR